MAKNFVQPGSRMEYVNAGSDIAAGTPISVGGVVGIAEVDIPSGESGNLLMEGVVEVAKNNATAMAQGDLIEWSNGGAEAVADAAGDFDLGYVWEAAASSATLVKVRLLHP